MPRSRLRSLKGKKEQLGGKYIPISAPWLLPSEAQPKAANNSWWDNNTWAGLGWRHVLVGQSALFRRLASGAIRCNGQLTYMTRNGKRDWSFSPTRFNIVLGTNLASWQRQRKSDLQDINLWKKERFSTSLSLRSCAKKRAFRIGACMVVVVSCCNVWLWKIFFFLLKGH